MVKEPTAAYPPKSAKSGPIEAAFGLSDADLRLVLEAGEVGGWEWDIGTGVVRWSENLERIHGLAPGSFANSFESYQAMVHPDDRERVIGALRSCIEGRGNYEIDFRSAESAGGERWIHAKGRVLSGEKGEPYRMIGVCWDITKRKRAEEALIENSRRKDEFLAMVSHELRNPLGVIMNASTLINHLADGDGDLSKASAAIRRQTDQLARIVDDLMDVSRIAAGKLTLERNNVDLVSLVHRCVHDCVERRLFDQHRHELRCAATHVTGDRPRLEQIVTNLLMNAIKYTPPGGRIIIEVEPDGGDAVLRVKDTGVGISPELLPRVFELFVQSERGLGRRDGGLGVGLAIVRSLVEAHGGRIDVWSPGVNGGAEFAVRLPLAATLSTSDPRGGVAARRRILVVDDNVDAREALARLLEIAGHEVYQAGDGPGGLEEASRSRPDVAIVDIGLPGMNGFEVARRLKASAPNLRLIALTGYGQGDHRRQGDEAGFETYLIKPVAFETLQRALANNN
jgi:two-component system CheB/CheR fusion protein